MLPTRTINNYVQPVQPQFSAKMYLFFSEADPKGATPTKDNSLYICKPFGLVKEGLNPG